MKRREFITLLGGAAAAWPVAARAQQPAMPVIGFMSARSPEDSCAACAAFQRGLGSGSSRVRMSSSNTAGREGHYDRLPALAAELVQRRVDVLVADRRDASALRGEGCDCDDPDCVRDRRRSGQGRSRRELQSAGRLM